jgi:hypothetical protein
VAIEYIDGFDHWTSSTYLNRKGWLHSVVINNASDGRRGGLLLNLTSTTSLARKTALSDKFCIGCAIRRPIGFDQVGDFFFLYDSLNAEYQCGLRFHADGSMSFKRGATVLETTDPGITSHDVWFYLELLVTIHGSTGSYEVRKDGTTILSGSGVNTQNGGTAQANRLYLSGGASSTGVSGGVHYDDLVIQSGAASAFLGDCRVDTFLPDSDGASAQFTPSAGSDNYAMVDDATNPDLDTTNVESSTIGHIDLYGFPALSHTPAAIYAVQVSPMVNKTDSGFRSMKPVMRSGGVNYEGDEKSIGADTFIWVPTIYEEDPDTSAAWTIAGVNALEAGQKVEA